MKNKNILRSLVVILFSLVMCTGCWNKREMNEMAFVMGIGFDKLGKKNYVVSFQIANPGSFIKTTSLRGDGQAFTVFTGKGRTISAAAANASKKVSRKLFFAHTQVIIVGNSLAKRGIDGVLDWMDRSMDFRTTTKIAIARHEHAEELLEVQTPLEKLSANHFKDELETSKNQWTEALSMDIDTIIQSLISKGSEPMISGVQVLEKKAGKAPNPYPYYLEFKGLAYFKGQKLKKWVDGKDIEGALWAKNSVSKLIVAADCRTKEDGVSVEVIRTKSAIATPLLHGQPELNLDVKAEGYIKEVNCPVDLADPKTINRIEKNLNGKVKRQIDDALHIAQKESTDVFGFGDVLSRKEPEYWKKVKNNWGHHFSEAKVNVNVHFLLQNSGKRNKPYLSHYK
ncbi:Ger(x)C family spore germination protein [Fictibacillus sp. FJAT-27399]|uniref:Ger(x)C family spore germination protein n=1 Tax=Fictibacillus sp. FJAT-27399 TaxID=1729689 RepID=UPI000784EB85|nr:Ger(x)C family spore germination protein [Fictibacillus sp. FJAT-27399]